MKNSEVPLLYSESASENLQRVAPLIVHIKTKLSLKAYRHLPQTRKHGITAGADLSQLT
jgi:hypothetical protein